MSQKRVFFSISVKLIVITSILLIAALGSITLLVSYFVSEDVRITAEENNYSVNSKNTAEIENKIETVTANVFLLLDMLNASGSSPLISQQAASFFFNRNPETAAVVIPGSKKLINTRFFKNNSLDTDLLTKYLEKTDSIIKRSSAGELLILNSTPFFGTPLMTLFIPRPSSPLIILFSSDSLSESFGANSINTAFAVNSDGDILVHPDISFVHSGANISSHPLVAKSKQLADDSRQLLFTDTDGSEFFGAYKKAAAGSITVYTTVQSDIVFEAVRATTRRNMYLTAGVLFLSILFIWFWSKTISTPVIKLAQAAHDIEQGQFDIQLTATTKDELGILTESFVSMGRGLAERERLKDTFGRFINKDIAEKAIRGELSLGGETKTVTTFFSDIRSFTAISEQLEPHEVVEFLNDYMSRMVACINKTGGVVDKYIGDAIMAVWGAPVSSGTARQDALNCVTAALMMRSSLREFNKGRGENRKPVLKIGCGINTGLVVAGQIGSRERMEYTVIGDSVNFASRTESLNKPLGTDILITENTYELIKDCVITEKMPSVTVKGKEKPVSIYAVISLCKEFAAADCEVSEFKTLSDVRAALGISAPDLTRVNIDEEEKKYSIQG